VIVLHDGHLWGGDSSMFYNGKYELGPNTFHATIVTNVHTIAPHKPSIFGRDIVHITLDGTYLHDYCQVTGVAREVPDIPFKASLTKLGD
jgi:hypothetical protein